MGILTNISELSEYIANEESLDIPVTFIGSIDLLRLYLSTYSTIQGSFLHRINKSAQYLRAEGTLN